MDSHLAAGIMVIGVEEKVNPHAAAPDRITTAVGGRVKTGACKKCVTPEEAAESVSSEDMRASSIMQTDQGEAAVNQGGAEVGQG